MFIYFMLQDRLHTLIIYLQRSFPSRSCAQNCELLDFSCELTQKSITVHVIIIIIYFLQ